MPVSELRYSAVSRARSVGAIDRRKILDRPPIRRILGLQLQLIVELFDHVSDRQLGVDDSFGLALLPLPNRLVDVGGEVAIALQIIVIVGDRPERRRALPAGDRRILGVQPVKVIHRQRFGDREQVRRVALERLLGLVFEHIVGDAVGRIQLVARDRAQRREIVLGSGLFRLEVRVAEQVAEPVGVAQVAAVESLERVALEARLVAFLEQLKQPLVRARLRRRGGGRLGGCTREGRQSEERCGKDQANGQHHRESLFEANGCAGRLMQKGRRGNRRNAPSMAGPAGSTRRSRGSRPRRCRSRYRPGWRRSSSAPRHSPEARRAGGTSTDR